jgi:hypothetical protein
MGKIGCRSDAHFRVVFVDRELALQQFQKQGGDALRSVERLLVKCGRGLHFRGKVQQFKHEVSQRVVFVQVIGVDFLEDALEDAAYFLCLFVRQLKNVCTLRLENLVLVQVAELMEKVLVENAIETGFDSLQAFRTCTESAGWRRKAPVF